MMRALAWEHGVRIGMFRENRACILHERGRWDHVCLHGRGALSKLREEGPCMGTWDGNWYVQGK